MTLELTAIVTAIEGRDANNKNRQQHHIVKEYIKIKVNGNSYDHLCEQMDEFVRVSEGKHPAPLFFCSMDLGESGRR